MEAAAKNIDEDTVIDVQRTFFETRTWTFFCIALPIIVLIFLLKKEISDCIFLFKYLFTIIYSPDLELLVAMLLYDIVWLSIRSSLLF